MSDLTVKLGQLIKIENKEKKSTENEFYIALQVEDYDGKNERCILFTENEVKNATRINYDNFFVENMKAGRLCPFIFNSYSYLIKVFDENEQELILKFSKKTIEAADLRASKNPEDLTKKSFFRDLID